MIRSIARMFLYASLFNLLPLIPGAHYHGDFFSTGLALGFLFEMTISLLHNLTKMFLLGALGKSLQTVSRALLLGYWVVSTVELKMLADDYPKVISFAAWPSAVAAGLAVLAINRFTRREFETRD